MEATTVKIDKPEGGWGRITLHVVNDELYLHSIPVADQNQEPAIVVIKPKDLGVFIS